MEVMVSVTIFTIIVTIGMGALITIFKTLQKTRADRQTIDSVSFVLDTMTRRIRTGKDYVGFDAGGGIKFTDQDGYTVQFYNGLDDQGISRIYMIDGALGADTTALDITPENFAVEGFVFDIIGTDPSDGIQPMVTINLKGTVRNGQEQSTLSVQTIVSQRLLDFPVTTDLVSDGGSVDLKKTTTSMTTRTLRLPVTESMLGASSSTTTTDTTTAPAAIDTTTTTTSTFKALNQPRTAQ